MKKNSTSERNRRLSRQRWSIAQINKDKKKDKTRHLSSDEPGENDGEVSTDAVTEIAANFLSVTSF